MNANVKKWVEALRSGDFEQGRSRLRSDDDKYCCLGVACELYVAENANLEVTEGYDCYYYGGYSVDLPRVVRDWLGGIPDEDENELIYLNDNKRRSFAEIADWIEGKYS